MNVHIHNCKCVILLALSIPSNVSYVCSLKFFINRDKVDKGKVNSFAAWNSMTTHVTSCHVSCTFDCYNIMQHLFYKFTSGTKKSVLFEREM